MNKNLFTAFAICASIILTENVYGANSSKQPAKAVADVSDEIKIIPAAEADAAFKRFFTVPFERKVMNVLYSISSSPKYKIHGRLWGNTEMHFRKGMESGFNAFKADMRLSKDGEVILCHDEGFTYSPRGRITRFNKNKYEMIHDMPLEKILKLRYGGTFMKKPLQTCTLDTMLSLCEKYGKVAYLTFRPDPWREGVAKRMTELIVKHNMQNRTIINLFWSSAKRPKDMISKYLPGLVYCHTLRGNVPLTKKLIDQSAADGFQIICLYYKNQIDAITPELCQYAAGKGIRIWCWGVGSKEAIAKCIAKGVSGFQNSAMDINDAVIDEMLK